MTVIQPAEPYASDPVKLLALCIWREARGESIEAKHGVAWTIRNRCAMAPREGFKREIAANVLHPGAFSSFIEGDPNAVKYPDSTDKSWQDSLAVAEEASAEDPTSGAVFYFSPPLTAAPHAWGPVRHTATIGGLQFFTI